jgi:hypothetical protein
VEDDAPLPEAGGAAGASLRSVAAAAGANRAEAEAPSSPSCCSATGAAARRTCAIWEEAPTAATSAGRTIAGAAAGGAPRIGRWAATGAAWTSAAPTVAPRSPSALRARLARASCRPRDRPPAGRTRSSESCAPSERRSLPGIAAWTRRPRARPPWPKPLRVPGDRSATLRASLVARRRRGAWVQSRPIPAHPRSRHRRRHSPSRLEPHRTMLRLRRCSEARRPRPRPRLRPAEHP